ncbi:hypothetical protein ACPV5G_21955, partial [Photobacterium damselae]|uniref:hypothetical protein n=1 Tax=Photobacterium damselae TaxID=38293 RepID=UPI00406934F0
RYKKKFKALLNSERGKAFLNAEGGHWVYIGRRDRELKKIDEAGAKAHHKQQQQQQQQFDISVDAEIKEFTRRKK